MLATAPMDLALGGMRDVSTSTIYGNMALEAFMASSGSIRLRVLCEEWKGENATVLLRSSWHSNTRAHVPTSEVAKS